MMERGYTIKVVCATLVTAVLSIQSVYANASGMAEARDIYRQYIQMRKIIGEEQSAWNTQRTALNDMLEVLRTEISQTRELIETLEDSASTADRRRAELRSQLEQSRHSSVSFNDAIASFEQRVAALLKRTPDILQREVAPLAARLPEDPSATRLSYSQRLQTVVGLLAQIDKFNGDLRSVTEIKTLDDGSHEVQTLYFGLASALFSNPSGTYAGFGTAGASGWEWTTVQGRDAVNIAAALDIYSARRAPVFVTVPIAVD